MIGWDKNSRAPVASGSDNISLYRGQMLPEPGTVKRLIEAIIASVKFVATLKIAVHSLLFFNEIQILINFCKWKITQICCQNWFHLISNALKCLRRSPRLPNRKRQRAFSARHSLSRVHFYISIPLPGPSLTEFLNPPLTIWKNNLVYRCYLLLNDDNNTKKRRESRKAYHCKLGQTPCMAFLQWEMLIFYWAQRLRPKRRWTLSL